MKDREIDAWLFSPFHMAELQAVLRDDPRIDTDAKTLPIGVKYKADDFFRSSNP